MSECVTTPITPADATGLDLATSALMHPTPAQTYSELVNRINIALSEKPWTIDEIGCFRKVRLTLFHIRDSRREQLRGWLMAKDAEASWRFPACLLKSLSEDFTSKGWSVVTNEYTPQDVELYFTPMAKA